MAPMATLSLVENPMQSTLSGGGGPGGFGLERQMHPVPVAVLLWVARLDPLDLDTEAEPPHGELGEAVEGIGGGKGHPIVGADRKREPKVLESPLTQQMRRSLASSREPHSSGGSGWQSQC
jgi:hypothetical protein